MIIQNVTKNVKKEALKENICKVCPVPVKKSKATHASIHEGRKDKRKVGSIYTNLSANEVEKQELKVVSCDMC